MAQTLQAKRRWDAIFKALNNCQPRIQYLASVTFTNEEEILMYR
jgi:hypothetical protein